MAHGSLGLMQNCQVPNDETIRLQQPLLDLLLIVNKSLHGLEYQDQRTYGSVVHMGSCRIYIINSSTSMFLGNCPL